MISQLECQPQLQGKRQALLSFTAKALLAEEDEKEPTASQG